MGGAANPGPTFFNHILNFTVFYWFKTFTTTKAYMKKNLMK